MTIIRPSEQRAEIAKAYLSGYADGWKRQGELLKNYVVDNSVILTTAKDIKNGDSFKKTLYDASYAEVFKIPRTIKYVGDSLSNSPIVSAYEKGEAKCKEFDAVA